MAPRERRQRSGNVDASFNSVSSINVPIQQTTIPTGEGIEENTTSSHGISILKEIFPDHGSSEGNSCKTPTGSGAVHRLLNSIPTPSRSSTSPTHALTSTTPLAAPSLPPPPPRPPLMTMTTPSPPCNPGLSYREKLRAGGRGAFQRAFDVGLMPKSMKQDWAARPEASINTRPITPSTSLSSPMSYSSATDHQGVWNATTPMQGTDYWANHMEHSQMIEQSQMMMPNGTNSQSLQQILPLFQQQAWSPVAMQHPGPQPQAMAQGQLAIDGSSLQVPQMHMQMQQMQMEPVPMQQMQMEPVPLQQMQMEPVRAVDASSEELYRCMAIVMPETAQLSCDKNLVAAQLQAAADCQCYED